MDIYQRIKWLNAYAVINEVAMQKALQEFINTFFEIEDNVIDKKIQASIKNFEFVQRKDI